MRTTAISCVPGVMRRGWRRGRTAKRGEESAEEFAWTVSIEIVFREEGYPGLVR